MTIPPLVRFGTSSWAYEGWQGLVYQRAYPKSRFSKDCLGEYAAYQSEGSALFRTVGIDHSFYRPGTAEQFAHYATQVPEEFRFCQKVWEEITIPIYAKHPRYGTKTGTANPRFLDTAAFTDLVLGPWQEGLGKRAGPCIFEFQRYGLSPDEFLPRLDAFLGRLPPGPNYAVEVRNPAILGARYSDILSTHRIAHVYNHWSTMLPLNVQHEKLGVTFTADIVLFRLLTPLGLSYSEAVERYTPYDRLQLPLPQMRMDTVRLTQQAVGEGRSVYVLVNNRAEGCAPMTVHELAKAFSAA
jgi:uncharacterized protein YecE (DUF72 family)